MPRPAPGARRIRLENVTLTFRERGAATFVLQPCSLDIAPAECLVVLGPSGSGKTTLLRIVAGLERPDAGRVLFDERDVTREPPERRGLGVVFAEDALFTHLTAGANIAYGCAGRDDALVRAAANSMRVAALLQRRVAELSGGERQRIALARALAREPGALLLDEPLGRLDAPLRAALRLELAALLRERRLTTVLVTHDQSEALALGTRVAVVRAGRIEQIASPREVYDRPANVFVASFVGSPVMAFLGADRLAAALPAMALPAGAASFGLRAEAVRVDAAGELGGMVDTVEDLGADAYAYVETEAGRLVTRLRGARPARGERVVLALDRTALHAFDGAGVRIGSARG